MAQTDVLVCGKCHNVFHFIELFQEHKDMGCEKDSELKDSRESKPKVWAFLLWKAAQLSLNENLANTTNSWKLYQQWVKMEDSVRETWIVAGKTIQSFAKVSEDCKSVQHWVFLWLFSTFRWDKEIYKKCL